LLDTFDSSHQRSNPLDEHSTWLASPTGLDFRGIGLAGFPQTRPWKFSNATGCLLRRMLKAKTSLIGILDCKTAE
jgi:hypothetical protein